MSVINIGYDASGNGNNWTPNNLVNDTIAPTTDVFVDTPTNYGTDTGAGGEVRGNYGTWNPLFLGSGYTLANGALQINGSLTNNMGSISTFGMSSGKWYWEITVSAIGGSGDWDIGIANNTIKTSDATVGHIDNGVSYRTTGDLRNGGGTMYISTSGQPTYTTGDVVMLALDAGTRQFWFGKNGTWLGSGNPATATNPTGLLNAYANYFAAIRPYGSSSTAYINAGQRPFTYTAPSGFKALCTENLSTPTILDGGDYFNAVLWTGNNTASQAITGVGFQPDLVWAKSRPANSGQDWVDAVRGATKNLQSSSTAGESTSNTVISFQSDGFTVGDGLGYDINKSGESVVGWCWKANGAGSSNTTGTISATVSANTTSGFSIITHTGTGSNGTIGHGLGVAPNFVLTKRRNTTEAWTGWHVGLSGGTYNIELNNTNAQQNSPTHYTAVPTSTVINLGTNTASNASGSTYVTYAFAPIAGFSAFGSYTGNGSTDGPFVYTGFRPRWIMCKYINTTSYWIVFDTVRNTYNLTNAGIQANSTAAETTGLFFIDVLSNGFKPRDAGGLNGNGNTVIYAAFAESPFKYSRAR